MERIFQIYKESTLQAFLKNELLSWLIINIIFTIIFISIIIFSFNKNMILSIIVLIAFVFFVVAMVKYINNKNQRRYPIRDNLMRILHYSLIEKNPYWTMPRFAKFYHKVKEIFDNRNELIDVIRKTRNHLKEVIAILDNMEKIIESPRRHLRYWFFGIGITAVLGLTYKIVEKQSIKSLILVLVAELIAFYLIFILYGIFFDKYYKRKYKIIELYNFIICAETLINLDKSES